MEAKEMIRELRRLEEKHKNDMISTGANNWSRMCHDIANKLEEQEETITRLKEQIFQLEAIKIGGELINVTDKGTVINIFDLANEDGN